MLFVSTLGQTDVIDVLAVCTTNLATCTTFSSVLANLIDIPPDRRVLVLIQQAMARGPGQNPFYASPQAIDVVRIHSEADRDLAARILMQAMAAVAQDLPTAQANQGKEGFFAHALNGLQASLQFRSGAVPADLRVEAVAFLRHLASMVLLPDTAERARAILRDLGESTLTPAAPVPVPVAVSTATSTGARPFTRTQKTALAVGLGVVVVGGIAILISVAGHREQARALGVGRLRRRVEARLRRH